MKAHEAQSRLKDYHARSLRYPRGRSYRKFPFTVC